MIRHMRHGSSPRLMTPQPIRGPNRREALATPSAGDRMSSPGPYAAAVAAGIITAHQADQLATFYGQDAGPAAPEAALPSTDGAGSSVFDLAHVLWYAGALIVMGAMGLFSTLAFSLMGGAALTATALVYAALF